MCPRHLPLPHYGLLLLHTSINIPSNAVIHRRGGLNPPDNTLKGVFVDVSGRKHSAPTVDENLSLTAMGQTSPLQVNV